MVTLKAALANFIVALTMVLQLANTAEASQPPESKPKAFVNPGTTWACGRLESTENQKACKLERRKNRLVRCLDKSDYRLWYCLTPKYCKEHSSKYGNKHFCTYNWSDNSGAGGTDTLPCINSTPMSGNCLFNISTESARSFSWNDDDEDFDKRRELYEDSIENVCDNCTLEGCKLRCHANYACKGINYNSNDRTCTMIYSGVTGASEVDIDGKSVHKLSKCYKRANENIAHPKSCTMEVITKKGESGGCWGAGEGYRPCGDDEYCSLDECKFLCTLNSKCQAYQIETNYSSSTCLHFSLLPKTVDTMVNAHCYSVARAHQYSSDCNTDDALPQGSL